MSVQVAAAIQTLKAPTLACARSLVPMASGLPLIPKAAPAVGYGGSYSGPAPTTTEPLRLNVPQRSMAMTSENPENVMTDAQVLP